MRKCELCQRAKTASVGLHSAKPSYQPMEKSVDFVGPLVRSKWGNITILVVVDAFSKFVSFYPVRKITSRVVSDCLERGFFPAYGTPKYVTMDNARVFFVGSLRICVFGGEWNISLPPLIIPKTP
jgi:hypothetical protein